MIVITFADHDAVTPAGSPLAVPIPVAPFVVWVIFVSAVLIQRVGVEDAALTVFAGEIFRIPVASTFPHPPVNGIM